MVAVCIEVFKRYILNAPTAWIFDLDNMLYGTLFMLCGAYTLAQDAHVRGDFLYGSMRPRTQAALDLALYILFFLPGVAGADLCRLRLRRHVLAHRRALEHHRRWAAGLPLQDGDPDRRRAGCCCRASPRSSAAWSACRTGDWPERLKDAEEIDVVEEQLAPATHVDEESRKIAIEQRARYRRGRAPARRSGRESHEAMSDPALGLTMLALIVVVIMMGFPTAFTLMGLGMFFGFIAFYDPAQPWTDNRVFDLMVERTLRRDDQRRADLDPAVRADGLRDGARRAGRQDVLQRSSSRSAACRRRSRSRP